MRVLTQKNTGNVPANTNKAINASQGEILSFMSLDDIWLPNQMKFMVGEIMQDQDLQMIVSSRCITIDVDGAQTGIINANVYKKDYNLLKVEDLLDMEKDLAGSFYMQGCLFKRSLIIDCGMYDEDMLGDDIVIRTKMFRYMLRHPNMKFQITDHIVCCYRISDSGIHKKRERQCEIIYQVAQRYFQGQTSPVLDDWIEGTIIHNIIHGSLKDALRLMIWDRKNKDKLRIFSRVFPILINHQINIYIRQKRLFICPVIAKIKKLFKEKFRIICQKIIVSARKILGIGK
jgi:hypothetical protein